MLRRVFAASALIATLWAALVWASGALVFSIGGIRISSSDSVRPLIVALVFFACYAVASGTAQLRRDAASTQRLTPASLTATLIVITLVAGLTHNSWTAGGTDAYSYVSQADLWLDGQLKTSIPLAADVPWPDGLATLTPFGYTPLPDEHAIAPTTAPGLPLMMAAFKLVGGHPAAFLVAPLSGGLLLWATFLLGRRLGSEGIGLGGAWLVATSPTFLMMFRSPMSDVPAAAFWALSTYWTLGASTGSAFTAGVAASMAIVIRPNLVPLAAVLGLWLILAGNRPRMLTFAAGAIPGSLAVALINNYLYGSPLASGYGELGQLFSPGHVPITLARYGQWFFETQTPIAAGGLAALAIAPRAIWPSPDARSAARLLAGLAIAVWALYSVYSPFEDWWYLRFLLPAWPAMCLGTAVLVMWALERVTIWHRTIGAGALVALGIFGLAVTMQRGVFPPGEGDRRYATIAQLIEPRTEPGAMILASIHAGATRYYSGRATMRFDLLDSMWLDRAVEWLQQHGRHPYLLIEDWEVPNFTMRFSGANRLGDLQLAPVLVYQAYQIPGKVYLFDFVRPDGLTIEPLPIRNPRPLCVLPASAAPL